MVWLEVGVRWNGVVGGGKGKQLQHRNLLPDEDGQLVVG